MTRLNSRLHFLSFALLDLRKVIQVEKKSIILQDRLQKLLILEISLLNLLTRHRNPTMDLGANEVDEFDIAIEIKTKSLSELQEIKIVLLFAMLQHLYEICEDFIIEERYESVAFFFWLCVFPPLVVCEVEDVAF
jgi:hypothetical protein